MFTLALRRGTLNNVTDVYRFDQSNSQRRKNSDSRLDTVESTKVHREGYCFPRFHSSLEEKNNSGFACPGLFARSLLCCLCSVVIFGTNMSFFLGFSPSRSLVSLFEISAFIPGSLQRWIFMAVLIETLPLDLGGGMCRVLECDWPEGADYFSGTEPLTVVPAPIKIPRCSCSRGSD